MLEKATDLLERCLEFGILTEEKNRKYPLRPNNLTVVLKALAVSLYTAYEVNVWRPDAIPPGDYYLTDGGLEWLISVFRGKSLAFNRMTYVFVFSKATEEDMKDLINYEGMRNFKGERGIKPKAGSKQPAVIVRRFGPKGLFKKEFPFDTLHEARDALFDLLKVYPATEFTLLRIRKLTKNGKATYYREQVPLILPPKKEKPVNLPTARRC